MSYNIGSDDLLGDKFYEYEENGTKDDILDEFLDRRVYETSYSPDKIEFNEFYQEADSLNTDIHSNLDKYNIQNDLNQKLNPQVQNSNEYISPLDDNNSLMNDDNDDFQSSNPILSHNSIVTDPTLDFSDASDSNSKDLNNIMSSNNSNTNESINFYELLRDEISKLKFGKYDMKVTPDSIDPSPDLLDFSPSVMNSLPYKLTISNLPDYSRVETQTKINFSLNPPPPQNLIHIPQDLISKNKFCLADDLSTLHPLILKNLLYMDCYVMTSNTEKSCNICPKCIKREQKRASRRRFGMDDNNQEDNSTHDLPQSTTGIIKNNPQSWADEAMIKKAIMFNCKEIVSFPPPNGLNNEKSLKLNARIICYCRHHQEVEGFKLLFVLKNYAGEVVAKQLSTNIMIMDRKKPISNSVASEKASATPKVKSECMEHDISQPISPNSIDELLDMTANYSSERNLKRKKMSIDDSSNSVNNPMYNGSTNGFSPLSNSDTNTSVNNHNLSKNVYQRTPSRIPDSLNSNLTNSPTILRIIPAEGPIRGGIEITLLGFNFNPNLSVKFGANPALATHCWSETTIVTYLPPASQPGQVLVTFEDFENTLTSQQQQIFTYTDDTDKQLIELALQIVGLKMNGKLEDAKNIARRIVGNDNTNSNSRTNSIHNSPDSTTSHNYSAQPVNEEGDKSTIMEWYNNAQDIVKKLTKLNYSTEEVLINFLKLVDLPNCPITIPNWQLTNNEGQTLLHLSTIKNYKKLIKFLMNHGCKIDLQDNQGLTPLFYASINGQRDLIHLFISCKANFNLRLSNDRTIKDYCDLNVLDIFDNESKEMYQLTKSNSIDSLNSIFEVKGLHVSKMVPQFNNDSEFADSEYSADYSESEIEDIDSIVETDNDSIANTEDNAVTNSTSASASSSSETEGIWQKVKKVFNASDDDLPTYDDLFPFGPSAGNPKPKSEVERQLNDCVEGSSQSKTSQVVNRTHTQSETQEAGDVLSDSSEDMIISYINHPRKTVENDKMLIFFWVPVLLLIVSLFISVSVIGYKFESIENIKTLVRDGLGNLMVGNERIKRVFSDVRT